MHFETKQLLSDSGKHIETKCVPRNYLAMRVEYKLMPRIVLVRIINVKSFFPARQTNKNKNINIKWICFACAFLPFGNCLQWKNRTNFYGNLLFFKFKSSNQHKSTQLLALNFKIFIFSFLLFACQSEMRNKSRIFDAIVILFMVSLITQTPHRITVSSISTVNNLNSLWCWKEGGVSDRHP